MLINFTLSTLFYFNAFKFRYYVVIPDYYYKITENKNKITYYSKKYSAEFNSPYYDLMIFRELAKGFFRSSYLNKECYDHTYNFKPSKIFLNPHDIKINYDDKNKNYIFSTGSVSLPSEITAFLNYLSKCYLNSYELKVYKKDTNKNELINLLVLLNLILMSILLIFFNLKRMSRLY